VGRLQPGVSAAQAQAALQPAFLQAAYTAQPRPPKNWAQLAVSPVQGAQALNDPNPALNTEMLALMAMVGLVLLIACANVALLVLARNQARQGDFRTPLALIANALLLVRSMRNVDHTVYGIRNPGLAVFDVSAPQDAPDGVFSRTQRTQFFQTLLQQLRATPGVQAATLLENRLGAGWSNNNGAVIDGVSPLGPNHFAAVRTNTVGADYFATLGQPLLAGRDFTDADVLAATQARALA